MCVYLTLIELHNLNRCSWLYVDYTLIKLLYKKRQKLLNNYEIKIQLAELLLPWPGLSLVNGRTLPSGPPAIPRALPSPIRPTLLLTLVFFVLPLGSVLHGWLSYLPTVWVQTLTLFISLSDPSAQVWPGGSWGREPSWMEFPTMWEMGTHGSC